MADQFIPPFDGDSELAKRYADEASKNNDLTEHIQESGLEALKARFGVAEEDESIRGEGFKLAEKGGLVIKPRPESTFGYYLASQIDVRDDIKTDSKSEMSKVFDEAKSAHDSDAVDFRDLEIDKIHKKPEDETVKTAEAEKTESVPKAMTSENAEKAAKAAETVPVKRGRGRPRKNPLPEEAVPKASAETEKKPTEETAKPVIEENDEETVSIVKKYNTHTKVVFEDPGLDDGIKRNSEDELEMLFAEKKERRKLWSPKRK